MLSPRRTDTMLLLLLHWPLILKSVRARLVETTLEVTQAYRSLDGVERSVILLNGSIPGPTIRCTKGGRVRVTVINSMMLDDGFLLHFHGIWQRGTPYMDGTTGSQCSIPPGGSFIYDFSVGDQVGTYWYHGHVDSMTRADGAYGAFIVDDPESPLKYDEERLLVLGDWFHSTGREMAAGVLQRPFYWHGDPKSILHNGKGNFSCGSQAVGDKCEQLPASQAAESITVQHGKTYLLRIISTTSMSFLDLAIDGHNMAIVEADGIYVEPYTVTHLQINSGERYSVLLSADQEPGSYWISTETRFRALVKGYAVLEYYQAPTTTTSASPVLPSSPPGPHPGAWSAEIQRLQAVYEAMSKNGTPASVWAPYRDRAYSLQAEAAIDWTRGVVAKSAAVRNYPVPSRSSRLLSFVGSQCRTESMTGSGLLTPYDPMTQTYTNGDTTEGFLKWCLNDITYMKSQNPSLLDAYFATLDEVRENKLILDVDDGEVLDVLLVNSKALNGVSEQHPWHLHGHSFWVLGHGMGTFDPQHDYAKLNWVNPPFRDTVTLFPFGWTIVRFHAGNVGVWPFHCHVESHVIMGMQFFLLVGKDRLPPPPDGFPLCGRSARYNKLATAALDANRENDGASTRPRSVAAIAVTFGVLLALSLIVNVILLVRKGGGCDAVARRFMAVHGPPVRVKKGNSETDQVEGDAGAAVSRCEPEIRVVDTTGI